MGSGLARWGLIHKSECSRKRNIRGTEDSMLNKKGFTLIELVLVIAILGILAISALPRFLNLAQDAEHSSRDGVVGAVRAGLALYRANDMVTNGGDGSYPAELSCDPTNCVAATTLADAATCDTAPNCFGNVLQTPVDDASWTRTNATTYVFNDGEADTTFTYDSTAGTFTE